MCNEKSILQLFENAVNHWRHCAKYLQRAKWRISEGPRGLGSPSLERRQIPLKVSSKPAPTTAGPQSQFGPGTLGLAPIFYRGQSNGLVWELFFRQGKQQPICQFLWMSLSPKLKRKFYDSKLFVFLVW